MPVIRSANDIILNMIDLLRVLRPSLDTKNGTVSRDLFVELPASQLALLYDELSNVSDLQSLRTALGSDLDALASNYGAARKTPVKSSGIALFTFSSIPATIPINKGDLIYSSNGASFSVVNGVSVNPTSSNLYRSVATKYKNDLDFLNITDQYAVEVTVQATSPGNSGNLSKYALVRSTTPGVSNVTNAVPFSGGTNQEDDPTFRNRVLSIFSGSNTGTALGYRNTALTDPSVLDALVIEPGDTLMTRDGTIVVENDDGTITIISEGTGGKVDIIILGQRLSEYTDSYIYQDKSNNNNPSDPKNNIVLGQIAGDANKTINRRRIDEIKNGVLPAQPVDTILEVTGSLSGSNYTPKNVDSLGRVTGNYEIIKDTGVFGGSPFGFDTLAWINDRVLFNEDRIKSQFNGQDNLTFSGMIDIPQIQQNFSITNENSKVSASDRSIITLLHTPATNITRVFNVNTGERYIISDQNLDGDDNINTTGRVRITGNTLPSTSDILQVDYIWIVSYDPYVDYDGRFISSNPRSVTDSTDWGLSNIIRNEMSLFTKNTDGAFYFGTVKHPISSIFTAEIFNQTDSIVTLISSGNFAGRLAVSVSGFSVPVDSVNSITLKNNTLEIFNTADGDSVITTERVIIGAQIRFNSTIILPSDTPATNGQSVTVFFNQVDTFTILGSSGNFNGNQITIPVSNFLDPNQNSVMLRVTYFANIQDAFTSSITNLPLSRSGNSFNINSNTGFTNSSISNTIRRENQTVQINGSNQPYIKLNITSSDFIVNTANIVSVININSGLEIWNSENIGTIEVDVNNFYNLIFSGLNSPDVGDNVLALYTSDDIKRTQPFTFDNDIVKQNIQTVQFDFSNDKFYIPIQEFVSDSISFDIIDPTTSEIVGSSTGNISAYDGYASVSSILTFNNITDILAKKMKVKNSFFPNNNGLYDITSIDTINNIITITNVINNINSNQISIIRLLDNREIWNSAGIIDIANDRMYLPTTSVVNSGDLAVLTIFTSNNLRQAPSKLSLTVSDQINNTGIVTISGTTLTKVNSTVFTATNNGLRQNVAEAIRQSLGALSSSQISSSIAIARIVKLEKVTTTTGNEVLSVDNDYDVLGTSIQDSVLYSNEMIDNDSLSNLEFILPTTSNNLNNLPKIGDKLRITFYYSSINDSESISFTRNGTLYTNKFFALINKVYISSGFSSTSVRFIMSYMNQPATGSRYTVFYDYTAPKQNERIIIRYNYNQLISDVTFNIENTRPINADVIVRAAKQLLIDLTMNIVVSPDFIASTSIVLQNLQDKLITAINTNTLGDILDASDLVTAAQSVDGVDRARVIYFNENGKEGQVLSITAKRDEYFVANNVIVGVENR